MPVRRRALLLLAAAALSMGAHFAWFSLFGPPARWGNDVRDFGAVTRSADIPAAVRAWAAAASGATSADTSTWPTPDSTRGARVYVIDVAPQLGRAAALTHRGERWVDDHHLYVRGPGAGSWREIPIPARFVLQDARLVATSRDTALLAVRWHSWYPPDYVRFLRSILRPELRAEYGVYRISLDGRNIRFLFPGHGLAVSPDRRRIAYFTSTNGFDGKHNLWIYDARDDRRTRIVSLVEADPGSGMSFACRWSDDSHALFVHGAAQRIGREQPHRWRRLQLVYLLADARLYDLRPERSEPHQ
jgi:hypothetical protein